MAGGFGTRLRPLSCFRPKLLFPIAGRPMIEWALEGLSKNGVDEAVLATNYMQEMIRNHLGRSFGRVKLHYSTEDSPLGTGGAIKRAERFLRKDKDFFVLNGDILSSPPIKEMFQKHTSTGATATIMLYQVKDPTHFGVAELDDSIRITRFVEKPSAKDAPSNWINAGVYVLNNKVFNYITPRGKVSVEREVFPVLASSRRLYGYKYRGEWFDIGRFEEYRNANNAYLSKVSDRRPMLADRVKVEGDAKLKPPLTVGSESTVKLGATLGPNTSVGEAAVIGEGSEVSDSILFGRVRLGRNSIVKGSIIGEAAVIEDNVEIGGGCVIGDHVLIRSNLTLKNDVRVCPYKEVNRSIDRPGIVT